MNFSAYSIRNPVPAILLFVLLTVAGVMAYISSTVQDFPDIEMPVVIVSASLPGATPAQLETDVARKIENAVAKVQNIKNIHTSVSDGSVVITAEFELEKNLSDAVNEVRDAVSSVQADLPSTLRTPTVSKIATGGRVVLTYMVTAADASKYASVAERDQAVSWYVDNTVNKRILGVKGVGSFNRNGGATRQISVELNPSKMASFHVSAADISRALASVQKESPSGRGDISGAEQSIRTIATAKTVQDVAALEIPLSNGQHLRLDQVAAVKDTVGEVRSIATYNGKPVVAFEVFRTKGASEIDLADKVGVAVKKLQAENPNFKIEKMIDNAAPIEENFKGSMDLLYEGAILAILVIFIFLRDWRSTIIATTALPLAIIPTFLGMAYFGYSLNTVTLLAMALIVGVLVDDAIVEIENIERHLRMGKSAYNAAMEAADEIGMAVIATTFSLVAVFLPTAFMSGIPGKFFKQFGWTAVLAIIASLLVARLLTPMMAAYFLKPKAEKKHADGWVMRTYLRAVRWCISHRFITCIFTALFFFGSIFIVQFLPQGFVPAADRNQTKINIELPPGSTLAETKAVAEQARIAAMQVKGVESLYGSIGGGGSGDGFNPGSSTSAEVRKAVYTVNTIHRSKRRESLVDIEAALRNKMSEIPGARFKVGQGDSGSIMQLALKSEDPVALAAVADQAIRELRTLKGIGNVSSSASLVRPEIVIKPNFALAATLGVTADSIGDVVRIATAGDYDLGLSKLNLAERQVPILVKLPDSTRGSLSDIAHLTVPSNKGPVMLGSIASIEMSSGPAEINRLNRLRNVSFDVELGSRTLGEVNAEAMALPVFKNLPPTVSIVEIGDAEEMKKLGVSFGIAMLVGVFCIYAVLVLLFKDFLQPITILSALPLSFGGAFLALFITGKALSMPSLIGLVMLLGIVAKNAILLVDYVVLSRAKGMQRFEAIVDACHKRARPIVMTTIAMVAGMLPLAIGMGADPSFRSPMAVTVIGGLITSTLLSLLVVPVVYSLVDGFKNRFKRLLPTKLTATDGANNADKAVGHH